MTTPRCLPAARVLGRRQHYYLSAGSDTHDVWNAQSGQVRVFAHLDGALTAEAFAQSLKAGHAYVIYGPLIFPAVMLRQHRQGEARRAAAPGFELEPVAGIRTAQLVSGEGKHAKASVLGRVRRARCTRTSQGSPATPSWYQLVVEDAAGRKAYTDPIWVELAASSPAAATHQ